MNVGTGICTANAGFLLLSCGIFEFCRHHGMKENMFGHGLIMAGTSRMQHPEFR